LRRLNPFCGVVEVVETEAGRAFSMNGRTWEVQVLVDAPAQSWGLLNRQQAGGGVKRLLRLGLWHRDEGLKRAPIDPSLDREAVLAAGAEVARALASHSHAVPFELVDCQELWLIGQDQRPLALLASAPAGERLPQPRDCKWRAATGMDAGFQSAALQRYGVGAPHGRPDQHARAVEALVQAAARKEQPRARWFIRDADGSGEEVDHAAEVRPACWFPDLTLRRDWLQRQQAELVEDYLDWLAPRLLTLQALSNPVREQLERAARSQALLVDVMYPLYPVVRNPDLIAATRVEAQLRRSVHGPLASLPENKKSALFSE
jgi:hypothetical protein